jgi:hypothetical protein
LLEKFLSISEINKRKKPKRDGLEKYRTQLFPKDFQKKL